MAAPRAAVQRTIGETTTNVDPLEARLFGLVVAPVRNGLRVGYVLSGHWLLQVGSSVGKTVTPPIMNRAPDGASGNAKGAPDRRPTPNM
jgi:hypothetical protein